MEYAIAFLSCATGQINGIVLHFFNEVREGSQILCATCHAAVAAKAPRHSERYYVSQRGLLS